MLNIKLNIFGKYGYQNFVFGIKRDWPQYRYDFGRCNFWLSNIIPHNRLYKLGYTYNKINILR